MRRRMVWILVGLVGIVVTLSGCEEMGVVATVNGEDVTVDEWNERCQLAMVGYVQWAQQRSQAGIQLAPVSYYALDQVIQEKVLMQLAKEKEALPTEKEVNEWLARLQRKDQNYLEKQRALGRDREYLKREIRTQIALYKLQTQGVDVTLTEVDEYIKQHPEDFIVPESVDYRMIGVTSEERKREVDRDLGSGITFAIVAQDRSEHPSAAQQGRMPKAALRDLPAEVRMAIERTPPLQTTDWIRAQQGWVKLYIEGKTPERKVTPTEDDKWQIRQDLRLVKARDIIPFNDIYNEAMDKAKVDIKKQYLATLWKQDQSNRKQAIKAREEAEAEAEGDGAGPVGGITGGGGGAAGQ